MRGNACVPSLNGTVGSTCVDVCWHSIRNMSCGTLLTDYTGVILAFASNASRYTGVPSGIGNKRRHPRHNRNTTVLARAARLPPQALWLPFFCARNTTEGAFCRAAHMRYTGACFRTTLKAHALLCTTSAHCGNAPRCGISLAAAKPTRLCSGSRPLQHTCHF